MKKKAICVYGASSSNIDPIYKDTAFEVGRLIALSGHPLVCGGGRAGLMAAAIEGARSVGGEAIGILPQFMIDKQWQHPELTTLIATADMHSRKRSMAEMSMAAIALPGGCGTLEELLEIVTWRQLNLFRGNIVIANVANYYAPLLTMLNDTIAKGFMRGDHKELWSVASQPTEIVEAALKETTDTDFSQKID